MRNSVFVSYFRVRLLFFPIVQLVVYLIVVLLMVWFVWVGVVSSSMPVFSVSVSLMSSIAFSSSVPIRSSMSILLV